MGATSGHDQEGRGLFIFYFLEAEDAGTSERLLIDDRVMIGMADPHEASAGNDESGHRVLLGSTSGHDQEGRGMILFLFLEA